MSQFYFYMMPEELPRFLRSLDAEFDLVFFGQGSRKEGYRNLEPIDLANDQRVIDYDKVYFGEEVPFERKITESVSDPARLGFIELEAPRFCDGGLVDCMMQGEEGFSRFSPREDEDERVMKLFRQAKYRLNKKLTHRGWRIMRRDDGEYVYEPCHYKMTDAVSDFLRSGGMLLDDDLSIGDRTVCEEPVGLKKRE